MPNQQSQTEVVVRSFFDRRQSGQGWKSRTDEVDKALCQRLVVEVSFQFGISEIAFQRDEMDALAESGGEDEVIKMVGGLFLCGRHRKVADSYVSLCVL